MNLSSLHDAEPIPAEARKEIDSLLQSGDLFRYHRAEGAPVTLLEDEFAQMMGTRFALAVSSCSAALFLSLKALNLSDKARVLIPGFTFAAVPSAVVHADCVPVLCEVGMNYRIDLADFEAKLPQVDAVIVSHMRGHTSDMDAIMALCGSAGVPVIEDAAHSLGTLWGGRKIGTLGRIGCFSFQSYKMINAGEGGIMITDDPGLIARAVIMSGAYEHNWQKHPIVGAEVEAWQNRLPLYNMRLSNLAAAVIRPQLRHLTQRVTDGLRNHDRLADILRTSDLVDVPAPLPPEQRAPDSIQFNLVGLSDDELKAFVRSAAARGIKVQVFGMSQDNARAFWNWQFLGSVDDLPATRAMLMRACDVRLPVHLDTSTVDAVGGALLDALAETKAAVAA